MKFKYQMLLTILILSTHVMLFTKTTDAAIFKCVNKQGSTFYNDKPCPKENVETEIKAVKAPKDPYIPQDMKTVNTNNEAKVNGVFVKDSSKKLEQNEKPKGSEISHSLGKKDKSTITKPDPSTIADVSNSTATNINNSQSTLMSTEPPGIIE